MSFTEAQRSTNNFQQYWVILKRRWLPASAVFSAVFLLTVVGLLLRKPVYEAEGKLLLKKTSSTPSLVGVGKEIGELTTLQDKSSPVDTEIEVIRSIPVLEKVITRLELKDDKGNFLKPSQLVQQLDVSAITRADVLQVSYKNTDPQKAAEVVNTVMGAYLESNLLANRSEAVAAREFLQKQLPIAEKNLRLAESDMRRFKEKNEVVALDEEAKAAVSVIVDLQRQINDTQTALADTKAQSDVLRNQLGKGLKESTGLTSISQLPAVQDLLKEVQQVESDLAVTQSRFQGNHPTVLSLKDKKADLEQLLKARVRKVFGAKNSNIDRLQNSGFDQKLTDDYVSLEARRIGLSSKLNALSSVQANYRSRVNTLPQLEQKQRQLERQLQASQATYSLLLQKLQEIRIAENQNIGNARVISAAAVPDKPIGSRQFAVLAAILLGGFAAGATAYVLEAIDKSIKTVDEAKQVFGFTLLGIIPQWKSDKVRVNHKDLERVTPEVVVRDSPRSLFSQSYRMLQANLKFLNSDREVKAIVVTSSIPKEGKSTVSANLAVAMAQMGRRVLLVDADMHRPLQHKIWELPNHLGLSNIIVGQTEPKTAIKKITANLHVLTSGVIPPNPMALLDSQRMTSLMSIFCANYDYTIVDAPALNCAADAAILGKMTDGIVLVVRPGVVDTVSAARAKEFLERSGQHVLGQVINGFDPKHEQYSYYHYSDIDDTEESVAATQYSLPLKTGNNS